MNISKKIRSVFRYASATVFACVLTSHLVLGQTVIAEYNFDSSLAPTTGAFGNASYGLTAATLNTTTICTDAVSSGVNSLKIPDISSLNTASFQVDLKINVTTLPTSTGTVFVLNTLQRGLQLYLDKFGKFQIYGRLTNGQSFVTQSTAN